MKRNMDLVRNILMIVESHEHGFAPEDIEISGYGEDVIGYHLVLMGEAGLLVVHTTTTFGASSPSAMVERMTWAGHEFLDNARNDTIWNKVKSTVASRGGSVSFDVLKFLMLETAKSYFGAALSLPLLPPKL